MPFDPAKRPDDDDFSRYVGYLEKLWASALQDKKEIDGLYYQTENVWADYYQRNQVPESLRVRPNFHSATAPSLVDQAVSAHLPLNPQFKRFPLGDGQAHARAASRLEAGLQAVYHDALVRAANLPVILNGKQIQMYNHTWLGVLLDLDSLVRPVRREGENQEDFDKRETVWEMTHLVWNPIKLEVPAPGEMLGDPRQTVPEVVIRRLSMKTYDLRDQMKIRQVHPGRHDRYVSAELLPDDPYADIELEEWWSPWWYVCRRKGGRILYSEKNTWGIQPWVQRFGSNAVTPAGEQFDPKWWVRQSFLWKERDTIRMIDQALVSHHALLLRKAWARLVTQEDASVVAQQMQGGLIQLDLKDLGIEPTPELPGQSFQHLQELQNLMERTSFSPLMSGFRQAGVNTATGMLILSENASRTFAANVTSLEHLHTVGASNVLRLVETVAREFGEGHEGIAIGDKTLAARDIGGKYHIQATMKQVDLVARQQAVQEALTLRREGLVGDEYVYEAAGIEDVTGVREDAIMSLARRDPDVVAQFVIDAWRKDGLTQLADQMQVQLDVRKQQRMMAPESSVLSAATNGQGPPGSTPFPGVPNAPA